MANIVPIKGLVLDMDGVFYMGNTLIDGAVQTLFFLRKNKIPFRIYYEYDDKITTGINGETCSVGS